MYVVKNGKREEIKDLSEIKENYDVKIFGGEINLWAFIGIIVLIILIIILVIMMLTGKGKGKGGSKSRSGSRSRSR